jgi:hypothetical protein
LFLEGYKLNSCPNFLNNIILILVFILEMVSFKV